MQTPIKLRPLGLALLALSCSLGLAEDAYYHVLLASLTLAEGKLPSNFQWTASTAQMAETLQPYAVLDGEGEAFPGGETLQPWRSADLTYQNIFLAVRAARGNLVTGRLFVPRADLKEMVALRFTLAAADEKPDSRREFFKAKEAFYRGLRERSIPGGAWFRHQEADAAIARGTKVAPGMTDPAFSPRRPRPWDDSFASTFELFSGGRALSENLQLERLLPPAGTNASLVALSNLTGITVREMDWKALCHDPKPAIDPLAANIPSDQHALFFPSFEAMSRWIEEADQDATPILHLFEDRAEDADSRARYPKQLGLELNDLSRLVGPKLITSIAFTGSDPYLRTGTDIGVLCETASPKALKTLIQAAQQSNPTIKPLEGDIAGVAYSGMVSPDRAVSAFVAALENVVLVSNSKAQLERLISVAKGTLPALASQDEYTYFRQKYPLAESGGETAFLVISDATIRRWCSPRWRIANSRRTCAAAALAELQAARLDEIVSGQIRPHLVATNLPEIGDVLLTTNGVLSSTYGTLNFLTPIIELPLTQVTRAEADAYARWRTGYQQNWSQVFDPIAVRFSSQPRRLSAKLSVVPLIAGSAYRQFMAVSTGARIAPAAGDPHPEALLHLALAINSESAPIKESGNFLSNFSPSLKVNPLGWLGQCVALYADQDPFWAELATADKSFDFLEKNYPRLPVALYCEVKNPLGLALFLAAGRAFAEQTAPGLTHWENLDYHGRAFVRITAGVPQQPQETGAVTNLSAYYAITPDSLVLTLSEPVLKRALDRRARLVGTPSTASQISNTVSSPWLGTNLCLRMDQSFVPALEALFSDEFRPARQRLAWSNLPILNEWKRRFPRQDPVKLHQQFWQTILICPGGGNYVWNEEWQTMESTVYGHPAQPKPGPDQILPVANLTSANFGLTFEHDGLAAKIVLERTEAKPVR